jgi:hypothetical protein
VLLRVHRDERSSVSSREKEEVTIPVKVTAAATSLLLVVGTAQAADLSGTYVGTDAGAAFLVEMVDSNGQITGRYEQQVMKGATIDDLNAALRGADDNGTVVLNLKPDGLLTGTVSLSGIGDGRTLNLAGDGFNLHLAKADDATWVADIAALGMKAKAAGAADAEAAELDKLEAFTKSVDDFVAHADDNLKQFPVVEGQLHAVTMQMQRGLDRERRTLGSVARGQIDVAIYQTSIQATQLWNTVESSWFEFQTSMGRLRPQAAAAGKLCTAVLAGASGGLDIKSQFQRWHDDCSHAFKSVVDYNARVAMLTTAYRHINGVWQVEGTAQATIKTAADKAEQ